MRESAPRPLARTLSIRFASTAIVPLAAVSFLVMPYLSRTTTRDVDEKNMVIARAVGGQVEVFLREPLMVLQNLSGLLQQGGDREVEEMNSLLRIHARHSGLFESIYLLGPAGKVLAAGFREGKEKFADDYLGLDLSHKDFFIESRETGRVTWSDTFLSLLSGKMAVALCLPAGERLLVGNFNLDILASFTERLSAGERVVTTIVDRQGYVIVHPDPVIAARQVNISRLLPVASGLRGETGTYRYDFEGQELLGSVALIEGPGWLALVSQAADDAYGPIRHTGTILLLGLVAAVLLSVPPAMLMARRVSRPLSELAARARVVGEGGYDFDFEPHHTLEINEMAESFGKMTEAVREREKKFRESEEKYRLLVENANDAIFVAQEGVLKFANPRTEEMTGLSSEELMRRPFVELVHAEDRDMVLDRHWKRLRGEDTPGSYAFRILGPGGTERWVMINSIRIDWEGKPATLNFVRDITEQKNLELQAFQAQKLEAVGTLAGGIAHDFNNLLQAIQGYAEICLMQSDPRSPSRQDLEEIIQSAQRGGELTRQLLLFSRKVDSRTRPVDLNAEVDRTVKILRRILPKMIEVEAKPGPGLRLVNADPSQIEQVIMNLAVNARDVMPDGGTLTIETKNLFLVDASEDHPGALPGDYVLLNVTDTGPGMEEDLLDRIFEPFFTTKEAGKGTGLGLAMVYGIVKNHGGHIACLSRPGRGTTFRIYLPAIDAEEETGGEVRVEDLKGGDETILLVDDEKPVREIGEKILTTFGYTVRTAASGEEALEIYRKERGRIDMVILDIIMPGMGGKKCLRELREIDPGARVLIASGFSSGGTTREAVDAGARGLIRKPYAVNQLLRVVRATLDGKV